MKIELPDLHPGQRVVWEDQARFQVMACGRRWGKTRAGGLRCLVTALQGGRAWWVAPSYPMASIGWRVMVRIARQIPGVQVRQVDRLITMPGGGTVQVRSADNPDSLRGEGLDFLVMDECAFIREEAWTEALRPALSDRQGRAWFISTPAGRNWFWRLWQRGQSPSQEAWQSWQFPTTGNPFIEAVEVEAARAGLPERIFRQEYLAEFMDDAGGVFRRVREAATAEHLETRRGVEQYVFGVDWGKHNDFTAIVVIELRQRQMVYLDRFNQIDYAVQVGRLRALAERFRPSTIVVERNSMGEPLVEQLQRDGLPVAPFMTTNASKTQAIDSLTMAFEQGALRILDDPVLLGELQAYQMERLPSGLMRYGAPEGLHDDTVMALALAWTAVAQTSSVSVYDYGPAAASYRSPRERMLDQDQFR